MIHAPVVADRASETHGAAAKPRVLPFTVLERDPTLSADWDRLASTASLPTLTRAFPTALACTLLAGAMIDLFLASGPDGISALLPLCRSPGAFARWRLLGAREVFEPHDLLCVSPAAARRLADAVTASRRPLALERLPAGSPLIPALAASLAGRGAVVVRPGVGCPTIALDASWIEPEAKFNSGRRSDFRRAARKAADLGAVTFEILSPTSAEFDALFDEAAAIEHSGWKRQAGTALASDAAKAEFFRTFFRSACEEGTFRLAFMRIDGRAVAMQMAVESLGRYWLFKIGYDEDVARCSPGTLLMLHSLGWAAGRDLVAYELLGQAEGWIADFWTRDSHACVRLRTYPYNLRGALALAADGFCWARVRAARLLRKVGG